jgi:hypothetical protein
MRALLRLGGWAGSDSKQVETGFQPVKISLRFSDNSEGLLQHVEVQDFEDADIA